jgi:HKD family nuclease
MISSTEEVAPMTSGLVVNDSRRQTSFSSSLKDLLRGAVSLDLAVSYVQISGWDLIEGLTTLIDRTKIRLLVTDQFGISHPDALKKAKRQGVRVRVFVGSRIYHPKVFIVYGSDGRPTGAIVGSANLSGSALESSVEVGFVLSEPQVLAEVVDWFEHLFRDQLGTTDLDDDLLRRLKQAWKAAAASRVLVRRVRRKVLPRSVRPSAPIAEDVDILEDLFHTIRLPIAVLNIDQAGNNIRNLTRLLQVLRRYPRIDSKERSELHLLGLLNGDKLTRTGKTVKTCKSEKDLAEKWCQWVYREKEAKLQNINPRIASFRRAATQFWGLQDVVIQFFLSSLQSKLKRNTLKMIELLCNGGDPVQHLDVSDFESLAPIISRVKELPVSLRWPVLEYWENKGSRSWSGNDRSTLLTAWRRVMKAKRTGGHS